MATSALLVTPQNVYILPLSAASSCTYLQIERHSATFEARHADKNCEEVVRLVKKAHSKNEVAHLTIFGIIGVFKSDDRRTADLLVVATSAISEGHIFLNRHQIWRLNRAALVRISDCDVRSSTTYAVKMLSSVLSTPHFYFCSTYDLTQSILGHGISGEDIFSFSDQARVDKKITACSKSKFIWNYSLLRGLPDVDESVGKLIDQMSIALIHGAVFIVRQQDDKLGRPNMEWVLISRRSTKRVGSRLAVRGANLEGHVVNAVETEQIVVLSATDDDSSDVSFVVSSYVQQRGSIPLIWQQKANLERKPDPALNTADANRADQIRTCTQHIRQSVREYGLPYVVVNLVDHRGAEGRLGTHFQDVCHQINLQLSAGDIVRLTPRLGLVDGQHGAAAGVEYVTFDFHHECRGMRYDRLQLLVAQLDELCVQIGSTILIGNTSLSRRIPCGYIVVAKQSGVIRTNCIDCLDRTNVVQSLLAERHLTHLLHNVPDLLADDRVKDLPSVLRLLSAVYKYEESHPNDAEETTAKSMFKAHAVFSQVLRLQFLHAWADHANLISIQYAGTPALKTDFTRTGRRTYSGIKSDVWNSIVRYVLNNFYDGDRTDAMRLFTCPVWANRILHRASETTGRGALKQATELPYLVPTICILVLFLVLSQINSVGWLLYLLICAYVIVTCGLSLGARLTNRPLFED